MRKSRPRLLRHQPGFPPADALRAVDRRRSAGLRHGGRRSRQDVAGRRAHPPCGRAQRCSSAVGPRLGRNQHAGAGVDARQGDAEPRRSSRRWWQSCASTRISDQDDAGPWIRREFPALHYIGLPSTPDGDQYYLATWTGISGDRFYKNAPGADFTTFTDEWVNTQHPQQGAARQALPDAVLHSRGRYAGVSRPHRQRPGELHEPDVRRLGRPLRLAHVLRRDETVLDAGRGLVPGARQLEGHGRPVSTAAPTRPIRRRSGGGARRSSTTSPRAWTGPSRSRRRRTTTPRSW